MARHEEIYDLLLDYARLDVEVEQIALGLHWTLCRANGVGLSRTVPGTAMPVQQRPLQGRSLAELSLWLRKWDRQQASIGLAAVNAAINPEADMVYAEGALFKGQGALSNSFDWFAPQLKGQTVMAAGSAVGLLRQCGVEEVVSLQLPGAIPPEAEQLLPKADWVFLPAETIADKTLPRLLEVAQGAQCVLYGTEVPWLDEWSDFGVNYLLGSQVDDAAQLCTQITEGVAEIEQSAALSYRTVDLDGRGQSQAARHVRRA